MESIDKFVKACVEDYEEFLDEHFSSGRQSTDFESCHQQTKSKIVSQLSEKWQDAMGPEEEMPEEVSTTVTEAIDRAFETLARSFEQTALREEKVDLETEAKNSALKNYTTEMDNFMWGHPSADLKDIIAAHTEASMAAVNMLKSNKEVSATTVLELKTEMHNLFKTYKDQANISEQSGKVPAIGIDLGTTMCCVMVYYNGKLELIPNRAQGNSNTTPSYVAYLDDGTDKFGSVAKDQAYRYPETTIYDAKRMIGRRWDDPILQEDRKHWPFEVVNEEGNPKVETWGKTRYPHEISARLLAQFRLMADDHLGLPLGTVTEAVITVPAYFTEPQRRATAEAAKCAGLEVLNILSEPTAAALAYSWERRDKKESRRAVIYDLGGGTFDVVVAVVESENVEILAVEGDTHLGGQNFDQLLMDYCIQEFSKKEQIDLLEGRNSDHKQTRDGVRSALARLKLRCEKAKEWLSSSSRTIIDVESIHQGKHMDVMVTRKRFEDLIRPLVQMTLDIVDRALVAAKSKGIAGKGDIDEVILVGGSTRVPLVVSMLSEHFSGKTLCKHINPDEAVAFGAAVQAAYFKNSETIPRIHFQDVTPMTLGVKKVGDRFAEIIPRNTPIPYSGISYGCTVKDNQTRIKFKVYQGESEKASENKLLGKFYLGGIPAKKAREEKAKVIMTIDARGLLNVKAISKTTGDSSGITITSDRLDMDMVTMENLQKQIQQQAISHFA